MTLPHKGGAFAQAVGLWMEFAGQSGIDPGELQPYSSGAQIRDST